MRSMRWICVVTCLLLSFCGCAGVSKSKTGPAVPPEAPGSLSYSTSSATYPVGSVIQANMPTSGGGTVASYNVVPTLPWGLKLDVTSGVITGIPTVPTPKTNYTVTAYNASGSTTATINITVTNGAPLTLAYSSNPAIYTVNAPIMVNVPSSTGGEPIK